MIQRVTSQLEAERVEMIRLPIASAPIVSFLFIALASLAVSASEVKVVQQQSQSDFLSGDLDGISVDPLGTLRLADKVEKVASLEEPFLFSIAKHPDGVIVGTGNQGRVLLVKDDGSVSELFSTEEPEVFAVHVDQDGSVLAGSSPGGKVYKWSPTTKEVSVIAEPGELYIWDLARDSNGDLLVATGTNGKLFRVSNGDVEVIYDSEDIHLRTLLVLAEGELIVGTAGKGLVLEVDISVGTRRRAKTLLDAAQPEIVALTSGPSGEVFVGALASEASLVDLTAATPTKSDSAETADKPDAGGTVSVKEGSVAAGSRPSGFTGGRSEIYSIDRSGGMESLWRFDKETVFSLLWQDERLWVSTGLEGQLYTYQGEKMVLEAAVDDKQIVGLLSGPDGPLFASTNAAAIYRVGGGSERQGTFVSKVIDAGQRAQYGSLYWEGSSPRGTSVSFAVRTGNSTDPDETWSDWTDKSVVKPGDAFEVSGVPPGRYSQWRADLEAPEGKTPQVDLVELSYLQMNRRPEFESVAVLDPGQIVVLANFNPSNQAYEPASPNRDGIFTTLDAKRTANDKKRFKTLWKKGYRTVKWEAKDPNEDPLLYSLAVKRTPDGSETSDASSGEQAIVDQDGWLAVAKDLKDPHFSFDSTVLPDGRYRFQVTATDKPNNPASLSLEAKRLTNVIVVDHTPPLLVDSRFVGDRIEIEVRDELNPIREAVVSVNAKPWQHVQVEGSLLDSRVEKLSIDLAPLEEGSKATVVLLRVTDAAHNVATFDLSGVQ